VRSQRKARFLSAFVALLLSAEAFAAGYSAPVNIVTIETVDTTAIARGVLTMSSRED